jgi:ParB-like chromosome segregation protein Spo0J
MRTLNASDFEPVETGAMRPKALARPLTASDFEPVQTPAEIERQAMAAEKGGLEQPAVDPAYVLADILTAGGASLPEGLAVAARAALRAGTESALYQKGADISQRLAGLVTTNPYIQGVAGIVLPMLTGTFLHRLAARAALARPLEGAAEAAKASETASPPKAAKAPKIIELHDFEAVPPPEPGAEEAKPVAAEAAPSEVKAASKDIETATKAAPQPSGDMLTQLEAVPGADVRRIRVADIKTAPELYQYKLAAGQEGAASLHNAKQFNEQLSGVLTVVPDPAEPGKYYVVNGHGRLALAKRTGQETVRVQILAPTTTPEQARAIGARINIAEGRGTAVDAAKFMRDTGTSPEQLADEGIDLSESMMQDAIALRNLSDPLFRDVATGRMEPGRGVVIGRELAGNPAAQDAIAATVRDLEAKGQSVSNAKLAEMIRLAKGSESGTEMQSDLFGLHEIQKSYAPQMADILTYVREQLGRDKRLFGSVVRHKGRLEAGGTQVGVEEATGISQGAAARVAVLNATAYSSGSETNQLLRKYARELANSPRGARAGILRDAYAEIYDALERDYGAQTRLGGITPEGGPGQRNLFTGPTSKPTGTGGTTLSGGIVPLQVVEAARNSLRTITDQVPDVWDDVRRIFAPETRGAGARRAHEIIREKTAAFRAGRVATEFGVHSELAGNPIGRTLAALRVYFGSLPPAEGYNFITKIQTGRTDELPPELQPFAQILRDAFDDTHATIDAMTDGGLAYRENYFPNLWKERDKAAALQAAEAPAGGRSLEGSKQFFKQRKFPTIADGLAAGLTPRFNNPVDLALAGLFDQHRFIMGQRTFQALKDAGLAKFFPLGEQPRGWQRIDDKIARVFQYSEAEHGFVARGHYWAPEDAATVINNFLSPSLRTTSALFRFWDTPNTFINTYRVALSFFHFTFTSIVDMALGVGDNGARAIGALLSGDFAEAARASMKAAVSATPYSVYRDYRTGSKIYRALIEPGSGGKQFEDAVNSVIKAGGSFGPQHYDTFAHSLAEAFDELGKEGKFGLFAVPRYLTYQASRPVMEYWVPRLKLGAFYRISRDQIAAAVRRQGSELTEVQLRAGLQGIWDLIDNTFGQLVRDNLAMKNGLKDALRMIISFPGWNIGSGRIIGGIIRGGGKALLRMPLDESAKQSLKFAAGLAVTAGIYGALLNRVLSGEWPKSIKDVYMPRTGGVNPDGTPERLRLPTYIRDAVGLAYHPVKTVASKLAPALQIVWEVLMNENYWGNQIYNPHDPYLAQGVQSIEHLGEYALPFSISSMRQARSPQAAVLSLFGVTSAPRWLTETPARALLDEYSRQARGSATPEQVEISRERSQLRQMLQKGDVQGFRAAFAEARKRSLTRRGAQQLFREAAEPPGLEAFKHLTLEQALQVYALANANERKQWTGALLHKLVHADPLEIDNNREAIKATLATIRQDRAKMPAPAAAAGAP